MARARGRGQGRAWLPLLVGAAHCNQTHAQERSPKRYEVQCSLNGRLQRSGIREPPARIH